MALCEIPIPAGYEFKHYGPCHPGDIYLNTEGSANVCLDRIPFYVVVLSKTYIPPDFLKPGWIARDENENWWWYEKEPKICMRDWCTTSEMMNLNCVNWEPPICGPWKESKRRIP